MARDGGSVDAGSIVGTRLVNTLVAIGLVAMSTATWVVPAALAEVVLITSLSGMSHALFLEWYFQGKEQMTETAVARTLGAALYLASLLALVHGPDDLRSAALAAVIGDLGSTGYLLVRYRRMYGRLRIHFRSWLPLMRSALPFGAGSVLGHLSVNFPILAVGALLGSAEAGVFSGANKLVFFLLMVDRILGTMLLPASVRLQLAADERLSATLAEALRWIVLVGLPLCIGGMFLATPLVTLVYGGTFAASGAVFGILVWYVLLTMIHTVYTSGVLATGREDRYRNVMVVSAILYVVAVSGGILMGGAVGAAAGVLLAEGVTVILMERALRPALQVLIPARFGRIVTAGIVLAASLTFLPPMHVSISVAAGAVVYIVAAVGVQAVTVPELREMIRRFA